MSELIIHQNGKASSVTFEAPARLQDVLQNAGVLLYQPCGGRGVCGKCTVRLTGDVAPMNPAETKAGSHLTCQATLTGDAEAYLQDTENLQQIESTTLNISNALHPMAGKFGAAVDIGTTTVVVQVLDLSTGKKLSEASERNNQIAISADVMGRIGAAKDGKLSLLSELIQSQIEKLLKEASKKASVAYDDIASLVITGNTTMLYLLVGQDTDCLSHAPFQADNLFDCTTELFGKTVYLPPCMSAFVGADISCAVLASSMCDKGETAVLCDVGTNGEMALWKDRILSVCSTAAGPAFEGEGISCGCSDILGAIDAVEVVNGKLSIHTIGNAPASGICGSGLIDAVAGLLETEEIDETGFLEDNYILSGNVALIPQDLRAVQLAKAAIAAGLQTMLQVTKTEEDTVRKLYLAGGFGNHLNVHKAARIGLFPKALTECATPIGNAALSGAVMLLLNTELHEKIRKIARNAVTVPLGGDPIFNQNYVDQMFFPESD